MRKTPEQNSVTMVTIHLEVGMCKDIIANSNITKAYVVNPCHSCNTADVITPVNAIHVHHPVCIKGLLWSIPIGFLLSI